MGRRDLSAANLVGECGDLGCRVARAGALDDTRPGCHRAHQREPSALAARAALAALLEAYLGRRSAAFSRG
jgi:hypothetical protein